MDEEQFGKGSVKALSNDCQKDVKRKHMFVTILWRAKFLFKERFHETNSFC